MESGEIRRPAVSMFAKWLLDPRIGPPVALAASFIVVFVVSFVTLTTSWMRDSTRHREWTDSSAPGLCRDIESTCTTAVAHQLAETDDAVRRNISIYGSLVDHKICRSTTSDQRALAACDATYADDARIHDAFRGCEADRKTRLAISCDVRDPGSYLQALARWIGEEAGALAAMATSIALVAYLSPVSLLLLTRIPHAGWRRVFIVASIGLTLAICLGIIIQEGASGFLVALFLLLPIFICTSFLLLSMRAVTRCIRRGFELEQPRDLRSDDPPERRPPSPHPVRSSDATRHVGTRRPRRVLYWAVVVSVLVVVFMAAIFRPGASEAAFYRTLGEVAGVTAIAFLVTVILRVVAKIRSRSAARLRAAVVELRSQREADRSPLDSTKITEFVERYRGMTSDELMNLLSRRDYATREALEALYTVLQERGVSREMISRFE